MFQQLTYRLRLFRRRHKYIFINSIFLLVIIIFLIYSYWSNLPAEDNSAIINEKGTYNRSLWESITMALFPPKTKPFEEKKPQVNPNNNQEVGVELGASEISQHKQQQQQQQHAKEPTTKTPLKSLVSDEAYQLNLKLINEQQEKYNRLHPFEQKRLQQGYEFFNNIFKIFYQAKPSVSQLNTYPSKKRIYHARFDSLADDDTIFSEKYLSQFLQLSNEELAAMKKSHKYVVENLPEDAPDGLYKKNGIVYVAGGSFNWLTLLSIKSLRAVGCHLPIEVFIPKIEEYESDLCNRILPELDARCIYMKNQLMNPNKDNLDSFANKFEFKGYQYKALAILLSSFENVLLLDSDNIPAHSPEELFETDPFKSYGLVVWPDYWKRATSPYYYNIADIDVSEKYLGSKYNEVEGQYTDLSVEKGSVELDKIPLHQRLGSIPDPTSESGQLLISKKTHLKPLLLALYYNLYGPSHYYPLFSQGSDGEGDKETFLAATVTLGKRYYQVAKFLVSLGHFKVPGGDFEGCGMGQFDPQQDLEYINLREQYAKIPEKDKEKQHKFKLQHQVLEKGPEILFVHANFPKLNPWKLKQEKKIFDAKGNRVRLYGPGMIKRIGYDFEWFQWEGMKYLLCIYDVNLQIFQDVKKSDLCDEILEHLRFLESTQNITD